MISLGLISVLGGIGMLWVFRCASDQTAIRKTRNRLKAHLYELRLYADEPSLVWRAQLELLKGNLRLIRLTLRPAVVLAVPFILLVLWLEPFFGRDPLPLGRPAVVTLQLKDSIDPSVQPPVLQAPPEISVETGPVRVIGQRQVSWRIRPMRQVSGSLRIVLPHETLEKRIDAGPGLRYLMPRREDSLLALLWYPAESRLSSTLAEWIEISYPSRQIRWLGLELHWLVWFVLISMASALLLKRRMGVSL